MQRTTMVLSVGVLAIATGGLLVFSRTSSGEAPPTSAATDRQPVEADMHEFMEYYFQPTYKRLRGSMAEATDGPERDWKAIKADSLILAEGGNLLLGRGPDKERGDWTEHAQKVRVLGAELYAAARKKHWTSTRNAYGEMLAACNRCHQEFAEGKHQLQP